MVERNEYICHLRIEGHFHTPHPPILLRCVHEPSSCSYHPPWRRRASAPLSFVGPWEAVVGRREERDDEMNIVSCCAARRVSMLHNLIHIYTRHLKTLTAANTSVLPACALLSHLPSPHSLPLSLHPTRDLPSLHWCGEIRGTT